MYLWRWNLKTSFELFASHDTYLYMKKALPSLKLTWPLKMDGWKMNFLLGRPIFRGELLVLGRVLISDPVNLGVSKNRGTPKWMVYNGKPYWNGWFGGTTIFGNTHLDNLKIASTKHRSTPKDFTCFLGDPVSQVALIFVSSLPQGRRSR